MDCAQLQENFPDILENVHTAEQDEHLKSCPACADMLSEIDLIVQQAELLQDEELEEPSPRVWNSIEIALRQEGLIREHRGELAIVHRSAPRWNRVWLVPVAVALVIGFGVLRYERANLHAPAAMDAASSGPVVETASLPRTALPSGPVDDEQLLEVVSSRGPTIRASYEADLQNVDAYIRDAERTARANPNDEEEQQYLMNAYEQKAMVYDLALNRPAP